MRKPNEEDLSDEAAGTGSVGDGFGGAVDLSGSTSYGDSFDDDYTFESDEPVSDDEADGSFDSEASGDSGDGEPTAFGEEVTEAEAEDILADMLDETYGPNADAAVESLEESSGRSALEILEDVTGLDLDSDGHVGGGVGEDISPLEGSSAVGSVDPFGGPDLPDDIAD